MKMTKGHWLLILLTVSYIIGFTAYYVSIQNYEFLWYVLVLVGLSLFIALTLKRSKLPLWILSLLSLWGLLHMAGGGVRIGGHVLYAQVLIPFIQHGEMTILKYDQAVHAFGFGLTAVIFYFLVSRKTGTAIPVLWLAILSICAAMGLGALNEVVEFSASLALSSNGVGGYINTGLDLVSNMVGAIIATIVYIRLKKKG